MTKQPQQAETKTSKKGSSISKPKNKKGKGKRVKTSFRWPVKVTPPRKGTLVTLNNKKYIANYGRFSDLFAILTYKRPAGSKTELAMIHHYIDVIPNMQIDTFGNRYVIVGDKQPETLFSCHTDTVHHKPGTQRMIIAHDDKRLMLAGNEPSNCLGTDDGSGIWLCLQMIKAAVPGLYIFHRQEERGGNGSRWISDNNAALLKGIKRAIAFDRKGTGDVITHQVRGRCCSDDFAIDLSSELYLASDYALIDYEPDPTGSFTDTANYIEQIPECTNLSVGYYDQHTDRESQDLNHLATLADTLIHVEWNSLPTVRDPSVIEKRRFSFAGLDDDYSYNGPVYSGVNTGVSPSMRYTPSSLEACITRQELINYIEENPEEIADLLYTSFKFGGP